MKNVKTEFIKKVEKKIDELIPDLQEDQKNKAIIILVADTSLGEFMDDAVCAVTRTNGRRSMLRALLATLWSNPDLKEIMAELSLEHALKAINKSLNEESKDEE